MRGLREDGAVSPVVGMILVLGISIVGIAAILYWGLPAIDEMKANVEHRSLQTQFQELNAAMQELMAGTTEKTAKRWQPALSRGSLSVATGTEPWLFAVEPYDARGHHNDFVWKDLSDGNNVFKIHSRNATTNVKVEAFIVRGTSQLDALVVSGGNVVHPNQMTGSNLPTWSAGTEETFTVYTTGGVAQNLVGETYKFRIYSDSTLIAEAWYVSTGRVEYNLSAGLAPRGVVGNNGAVLTGDSRGVVLMQQPPIPPPTNTSGVTRVFARAVILQGTESFGGEHRFDLLVSLYASATYANYDCLYYQSSKSDCLESVKIFNYGNYQTPWYRYLTDTDRGYKMAQRTVAGQDYIEHREGYLAFTLLGSTVKLSR